MKQIKFRSFCLAACAAITAAAEGVAPNVKDVALVQAPDRTVTVTYELENAPAVITFSIETNGPSGWARIDSSALTATSGDLGRLIQPSSGRTITWKPRKDFKDVSLPAARAVVTAWPVDNPPAYMVINLLPGATDRVRYYEDEAALPYGGVLSNDIYRTTSLVMKKVIAKGVRWNMGSINETGRSKSKEKLHEVSLADNYYLAVFQLTQRQHTLINGGTAPTRRFTVNGDMRPSDVVTRIDAVGSVNGGTTILTPSADSICGKLKTMTGVAFDLPGEAQWEFAARAGCGDGYWPVDGEQAMAISGDVDANLPGRYRQNDGWPTDQLDQYNIPLTTLDIDFATAIVGSYRPNKWGFYDMCGNVREWCRDWWKEDISEDGGAIISEKISENGFACRGGGIGDNASDCRPACRMMASEQWKWSIMSQFWGVRLWAPAEAK